MVNAFIRKNSYIWPLIGSVILWLMIGWISKQFGVASLFSSAKLATFALLLGLAQMLVVTSGDGAIDLSLIYIFTLCAYVSSDLMKNNLVLGLIVALAVGALCGLLNGSINVFFRIPAMITTLATGYIYFTIILVAAPHMTTLPNANFVQFFNIDFAGISMLTFLSILIAGILALLLYKTPYGKELHAVGQNKQIAELAGVNVVKTKLIAFTVAGTLAGISGVLCGAFIGGAFQDMGSTYFLPAIAAVFVGGTAASGGKSSVLGVSFGALMMSLMTTFLNTANLKPGIQKLILGVFLIFLLVASVGGVNRKK